MRYRTMRHAPDIITCCTELRAFVTNGEVTFDSDAVNLLEELLNVTTDIGMAFRQPFCERMAKDTNVLMS